MTLFAKVIDAGANLIFTVNIANTTALVPAISATLARLTGTVTPAAGFANTTITLSGPARRTDGIYGVQLETGLVATSYIPNTGTGVATRAADAATFTVPAGVGHLLYTFDDNSTQLVTVSAGSYTIPTTLNRSNIKSIVGSA